MGIKENLYKIKEQINNLNVKIIAVTKYAACEQIVEAFNLGIKDFGESYLQDALEKISSDGQLKNLKSDIKWHFIGRLQKNKIKQITGNFYLIHSVDSQEITELINQAADFKNLTQDILLQVNISGEETKGGFKKEELLNVFKRINTLSKIRIKGLMTIAPKTENKEIIRECFSGLYNLKNEINKDFSGQLTELSMGMSNDYQTALDCGSTILRLGRAIFNDQNQKGG